MFISYFSYLFVFKPIIHCLCSIRDKVLKADKAHALILISFKIVVIFLRALIFRINFRISLSTQNINIIFTLKLTLIFFYPQA